MRERASGRLGRSPRWSSFGAEGLSRSEETSSRVLRSRRDPSDVHRPPFVTCGSSAPSDGSTAAEKGFGVRSSGPNSLLVLIESRTLLFRRPRMIKRGSEALRCLTCASEA